MLLYLKMDAAALPETQASRVGCFKTRARARATGTEDGAGSVNVATAAGATPAYGAALRGHVEVLKRLHGAGADLAAADTHGATPLHAAVFHCHADVLDYLLQVRGNGTCTSLPRD